MIKELQKNELIAFLNLATEFVNVDKKVKLEEKQVLDKYLKAFNITKEEVKAMDSDAAIEILIATNSERTKSLAYFELLGLALIDGEYESNEVDYLEMLAEKFNISRAKKIAFANYYFNYDEIIKLSLEEKIKKIEEII